MIFCNVSLQVTAVSSVNRLSYLYQRLLSTYLDFFMLPGKQRGGGDEFIREPSWMIKKHFHKHTLWGPRMCLFPSLPNIPFSLLYCCLILHFPHYGNIVKEHKRGCTGRQCYGGERGVAKWGRRLRRLCLRWLEEGLFILMEFRLSCNLQSPER